MKIAGIGYITGGNRIIVSYDTINKNFIIDEIYQDRDLGVTVGFRYNASSKEEVRESLQKFKKDFFNK